jgi:hypothetical protein
MNRKYIFYVYDVRTTMSEYVASFAIREHAESWGRSMFGEHAYVTDRHMHVSGRMWNGIDGKVDHK